jgi:hypothetical protein
VEAAFEGREIVADPLVTAEQEMPPAQPLRVLGLPRLHLIDVERAE